MEFPKGKLSRIVSLVKDGQDILDVGCGDGALAQRLVTKSKKNRIVGIEVEKTRAVEAGKFMKEVLVADVEDQNTFELISETFDVIVFSEVLEHCRAPERILERAKKLLKGEGYVIICLPNVAFWKTRLNLLMGNWNYTEEGILDRTHLRFFTLKRRLSSSQGLDTTWKWCFQHIIA